MFDKIPDLTQPELAPLWGALMAFLRGWYRGKRWKARTLEGLMMGIVLLGVIPVLKQFGFSLEYALIIAGWAGYVGVDTFADWVGKKLGIEGKR